MHTAKITSKGQITIPKEMREILRLKPGDRIDFYQIHPGEFTLIARNRSIMDLEGCLPKLGYAPTIEEMNQAVLEAAAKNYRAGIGSTEDASGNEAA